MKVLDMHGLADNTVVVFTSDHGWQLGEHAEWAKQTNFELATRVVTMIKVPGMTEVFNCHDLFVVAYTTVLYHSKTRTLFPSLNSFH